MPGSTFLSPITFFQRKLEFTIKRTSADRQLTSALEDRSLSQRWQWWCPRCGYKQISSTLFTTWTLHRLYLRNKHGMLSHGIMLKSYFIILHFWTLHLLKTESKLPLGQSEFSSSNIRSLQRYWWYGFSIHTDYIVCMWMKISGHQGFWN